MSPITRLVLACLCISAWLPALAIDVDRPIADAEQHALYESLTEEVRCLVCQNQSLADSSAPLAADLRREIRDLVEAGSNEQEIKQFLTERYGDFVLYRPRTTGPAAVLWVTPFALLLIGALVLWRIVRRRAALPVTTDAEDAQDDETAWE